MKHTGLAMTLVGMLAAPLMISTPAHSERLRWQIDPKHSSVHFSVRHLMISTVRGVLGPVSGTIDYDARSLQSIVVQASIDVAGINTGNESRDRDLRSADFFDVARYPSIAFRSTRVLSLTDGMCRIAGQLTMHGVTKNVVLDVEGPSPVLEQPDGTLRIGAAATTTLNRREFGLLYNRMVEATPVVADQIHIQIDIEATSTPSDTAAHAVGRP